MKIGDRVYVHGYIDEIRKDTVIIRNNGGYFGTVPSEVVTGELPSAQPEPKTGMWIKVFQRNKFIVCACSECGAESIIWRDAKYCPNCGAKME